MKKLYSLLSLLTISLIVNAQTVPGGDMENWRTNSSGALGHTPFVIQAPDYWFGADSLIIYDGEFFGGIVGYGDTDWHRQIFIESSIVHGGSHSAKIMTVADSVIGVFPGIMANAKINVAINPVTMSAGTPTYTGGMPITDSTQRPSTVSAWTQYYPGKDSLGVHRSDTGLLTVQAISTLHGYDSIIGTGVVLIPPSTSWTQLTANIVYIPGDSLMIVDTVRIIVASSGGARVSMDSSTLYIDDMTMTSVPQISHAGVKNVSAANDLIKVYPNPASGILYLYGPHNAGFTCELLSVNGKEVMNKALTGNDALDISELPAGLYFYTVYSAAGQSVQRGKVSIAR